jgi:hypothetical protein
MPGRRHLVAVLAIVAGAVALPQSDAGAAQDPGLATFTHPRPESVVVRDDVLTARLRVMPGVAVARVTLNGRRVRPRVGPRRGGVRTLTLRRAHGLRDGRNVLGISTRRAATGDSDFDQRRFWFAERDETLMVLGAPRAGAAVAPLPVATVVRTRVPVERIRAWLNGRPVAERFGRPDGANRRRVRLGAAEGLAHGRNVLTVEAVRGNRFMRISRVFTVEGRRPLVSAGADRSIKAGQPVTLRSSAQGPIVARDGRPATRRQAARTPLTHSWRILRTPAGSAATLAGAGTSRPSLLTDVPGRYVLQAVARQGATASAPDIVVINAFNGVATPVATVAQRDGIYGVRIGEEFIANPGGATPAAQLVVLDRATLELQANIAIPSGVAGLKALTTRLGALTSSSTTILVVPPGAALVTAKELASPATEVEVLVLLAGLGKLLGTGAAAALDGLALSPRGLAGPFSVIAIPTVQAASWSFAPEGVGNGSLNGNFVLDVNENAAFSFAEFPEFDTNAAGPSSAPNTVTVGSESYAAPALPATAGGGFQVVVLDGYSLAPIANQTFATNSPDPATAAAAITAMTATLKGANDNGGRLIAVASIGAAAPTGFASPIDAAWTALGVEIHRMGGTRDVFLRLRGSDTYALVGAAATNDVPGAATGSSPAVPVFVPGAEASSLVTPGTARGVTGIAARGDDSLFRPGVAAPGDGLNYELAQIAFQPATPWPTPDTPAFRQANAYIAQALGLSGTDVRADYTNEDNDFGGSLLTDLLALPLPLDPGFPVAEFRQLQAEFSREFTWVSNVHTYFANIQQPFEQSEVHAYVDLEEIASTVITAINKDIAKDQTTASVLDLIANAMVTVSRLDPTLKAAGVLAAGFTAVASLATNGDGAAVTAVNAKGAELGAEFAEAVATQLEGLGVLSDVIVSDFGKLQAVGTKVTSDPAWAWDATTTPIAAQRLTDGATQGFYGSLMSVYWAAWRISGPWTNARSVSCVAGFRDTIAAWEEEPDSGQAYLAEGVRADGSVTGRIWAWGHGTPRTVFFDVPPSSFTDPLFESIDSGGVGLVKSWFFTREFAPVDWARLAKPAFEGRTCPNAKSAP